VDEGIGVGDNAGNLPEDVAVEVDAWKARILDGEFVVPFDAATFAEFSVE
jgi:basic membrane lipoprotein Med (substrate-binding protein (PBP1-ABC) superfamily)